MASTNYWKQVFSVDSYNDSEDGIKHCTSRGLPLGELLTRLKVPKKGGTKSMIAPVIGGYRWTSWRVLKYPLPMGSGWVFKISTFGPIDN